ncbi:cytochrome d ubiquinol oxidase subunit II [Bosea eneae]|uniref:Cytochrome d ubiquinol oxidase subunit II n=1 Tax=Bosea eneae TaxID=151454 RepID=A0ABW0IXZ7_9HYPH
MDLALLSAFFLAFALTLYVLLDGFDLGVGALLLLPRDEALRDHMVDAIAPTWDGNETWLIMAGVTLLAAFPIAYGILLPAFYLPLIAMLLALGLRGVSFEFRQHTTSARPRWDAIFCGGSVVAALCQGAIVGGLIQGIAVEGEAFAGRPLDFATPFALLTALTLLAGYASLGAGWLRLKGQPPARLLSRRLAWFPLVFAALGGLTCVSAAAVQPRVAAAWSVQPLPLAFVSVTFLVLAVWLHRRLSSEGHDAAPFVIGVAMFGCGVAGLGLAIFPDVVPFRLSLWDAASGTASHAFLLIGAAVVTPIVLAYSAFAYWVFRGRTPDAGWEA